MGDLVKLHDAHARRDIVIAKYGGRNLSKILGVTHAAICKWKVIPPFRAFQIAQLGDYTMEYIRPDVQFYINK
tara:strand:- start:538 stop:756 length:219 start_codon:yes stop_codon:yes gene_type:complete